MLYFGRLIDLLGLIQQGLESTSLSCESGLRRRLGRQGRAAPMSPRSWRLRRRR